MAAMAWGMPLPSVPVKTLRVSQAMAASASGVRA